MTADASSRSMLSRVRKRLSGEGVGAVLVRGATGSAGAHVSGAALALLAQLLLARLLGVSQYGYYVYALTWVMICAHLCRLGFQNSLIRFTASYRASGEWAALRGVAVRSAQLATGAAVLAAIALVGIATLLRGYMDAGQYTTFLVAALAILPMTWLGISQGLLQGYRRTAKAILPFRALTHGGTLVLAAAAGFTVGIDAAPVAMSLTLAAALTSAGVAFHWIRGTLGPDIADVASAYQTRYWIRVSLPLLLMAGMQMLMKQTDTAMLGALVGTDAAGIYYPVARISELAAIGLLSGNAIVAPMISEFHTRGEHGRLQRLLTFAAIGTSSVTLLAAVAFWLVGEWALSLFGSGFAAGYPALMILLLGQMVNALCGPVGYLMTMTGHQDRASIVLIGGALTNVVLNAMLIPSFGLVGAATATATSVAFWNLWMLVEVLHRHRLNPSIFAPWPRLWR